MSRAVNTGRGLTVAVADLQWESLSAILLCFKLPYIYIYVRVCVCVCVCMYTGNTNEKGRQSTVDFLIKVACFIMKVKKVCYIKSSRAKLVSTRRSTLLNLIKGSLLYIYMHLCVCV
jgi:hypothetical protein